eukprot:4115426-Pyramimonas_sp.AAC.1
MKKHARNQTPHGEWTSERWQVEQAGSQGNGSRGLSRLSGPGAARKRAPGQSTARLRTKSWSWAAALR